jgi:hypothetical protein
MSTARVHHGQVPGDLAKGNVMNDTDEIHSYVLHLRAEHRELENVVEAVRQVINDPPPDLSKEPLTTCLSERLVSLRRQLDLHFAMEDQGGCLEEALSHQPGLIDDVRRLEAEHPILLAQLDDIILRVRAGDYPADAIEKFQLDFDEFVHRLRAHEAGENRVLQFGLNVDLGIDNGV